MRLLPNRLILNATALFVVAGVTTGCGVLFGSFGKSWNSEMTVQLELNGKSYSGSGVVKVCPYARGGIEQGRGSIYRYSGEAIPIEIADSQVLFVLWEADTFAYRVSEFRDDTDQQSRRLKAMWKRYAKAAPSYSLPEAYFPTFVYFDDLDRPDTAKVLQNEEDFSKAFGGAARNVRVEVGVSKLKPTQDRLGAYIPWVLEGPSRYLNLELRKASPRRGGPPEAYLMTSKFWDSC